MECFNRARLKVKRQNELFEGELGLRHSAMGSNVSMDLSSQIDPSFSIDQSSPMEPNSMNPSSSLSGRFFDLTL